jgi:hypothetical protein
MACKQRDWTTLKLTLVNVSNRCRPVNNLHAANVSSIDQSWSIDGQLCGSLPPIE